MSFEWLPSLARGAPPEAVRGAFLQSLSLPYVKGGTAQSGEGIVNSSFYLQRIYSKLDVLPFAITTSASTKICKYL